MSTTWPASEKQLAFIMKLIDEREVGQAYVDDLTSMITDDQLTSKSASVHIGYLLDQPHKAKAAAHDKVTEAGMYMKDGVIFKVQVAVHGSGNLYAKRLVPPSRFATKATFTYEQGAINRLRPQDRMTLEDAKQFGALYGTCCVCGRTLTNEESIEAGIGPVCSGKI